MTPIVRQLGSRKDVGSGFEALGGRANGVQGFSGWDFGLAVTWLIS